MKKAKPHLLSRHSSKRQGTKKPAEYIPRGTDSAGTNRLLLTDHWPTNTAPTPNCASLFIVELCTIPEVSQPVALYIFGMNDACGNDCLNSTCSHGLQGIPWSTSTVNSPEG